MVAALGVLTGAGRFPHLSLGVSLGAPYGILLVEQLGKLAQLVAVVWLCFIMSRNQEGTCAYVESPYLPFHVVSPSRQTGKVADAWIHAHSSFVLQWQSVKMWLVSTPALCICYIYSPILPSASLLAPRSTVLLLILYDLLFSVQITLA